MSTGGIFILVTNDGKQDKMLMANQFLQQRLASINAANMARNRSSDPNELRNLPTLVDIEKTHVLFTNAHFKPFVAMGFEYNKVRPNAGATTLGNTIQFSIPQFGDLFHDICAHVTLTQPTMTTTASLACDYPAMRWCAFPGERLFQSVVMEVNGNPLDDYTFHATNFYREYRVAVNKRLGWDRCMGQEEPEVGFINQNTWVNSADAAASHRVGVQVYNGNQTPSLQKNVAAAGNLEMFIPLLFWYNKDVSLSVPSVAIPFGQRFINITLASRDQLVDVFPRGSSTWASPGGSITTDPTLTIELYVNNIFLNPEIHKIYIKRVGFSLIRVYRQQIFAATAATGEVLLQQLKWPIEYLYIGMKITDYFNASSATTKRTHLDKWHLFSSIADGTYATTGQMVQKRALAITAGMTITVTVTTGAVSWPGAGLWLETGAVGDIYEIRCNKFTVSSAPPAAGVATLTIFSPPPLATLTAIPAAECFRVVQQGLSMTTQVKTATLDTVSIVAHGIEIYKAFPAKFFNAYTTYHYGGPNINVPCDTGCLFVPFCLYPGTYQPSGHINVSRAREFYLNYTSSVIASGTPGSLVIVASAINFLLISDGSAVLRYST